MDRSAYRAAWSQERLEEFERKADQLARLYTSGFEMGLRGQDTAGWLGLEGTRDVSRMFRSGNTAGLRRRKQLAAG